MLAASPLFQGCSVPEGAFTVSQYRAGQVVHDTPKGVPSVGAVAAGRIDVYSVAVDGRDVWLNSLYTGECFGIYNLVAASDLETVLCCGEDTVICYIDKVTLRRWMETDQKLAFQYAALCNAKLQFLIKRIEQLTTQTCCGKIAAYLLAHRSADGQVKSSCSRDGLARQLGVSRATLFRALSSLQAAGVIAAQSEGFVITDSDGLEQILYSSAK
jgi:cyclic nucleotide-binding protein